MGLHGLTYGAGVVAVGMGNLFRSSREIEVKEDNGQPRKSSQCSRELQGCSGHEGVRLGRGQVPREGSRTKETKQHSEVSGGHGEAEVTVLLGEG